MKTTRQQAKGWEERFREMWDRDFAEPCKHNPDQFIVLSPIKYLEFIEHLLEKERINGAIEARDVIAKELKSLAEALLKIKPKENNE